MSNAAIRSAESLNDTNSHVLDMLEEYQNQKVSVLSSNAAGSGYGGALYCEDCSAVVLRDTVLVLNNALLGGAVYTSKCTPDVRGSGCGAGGLFMVLDGLQMRLNSASSTFSSFSPPGMGGAVYTDATFFALRNLNLSANGAKMGGGVYWIPSQGVLADPLRRNS